MKLRNILNLCLASILLNGCALTAKNMNPSACLYINPPSNDILQIYINPQIQEDFQVKSTGLKKVKISGYRQSLKNGFENSFGEHFESIVFPTNMPNHGLVLSLKRAEPKHIKAAAITTTSYSGDYASNYTNYEVKFRINTYAELYQDGIKTKYISEKVISEESTHIAWETDSVLEDALRVMIETIGEQLF